MQKIRGTTMKIRDVSEGIAKERDERKTNSELELKKSRRIQTIQKSS
jgi:hypothetical protein